MDIEPAAGCLLPNLLHFARLLRRVGLAVSTTELAVLARALTYVDLARRDDVHTAMRCILTHTPDEQALFDQAFQAFWAGLQAWMVEAEAGRRARVARAAAQEEPPGKETIHHERMEDETGEPPAEEQPEAKTDIQATYSASEILRAKDFASYTAEELRAAQRFIDSLAWQLSQHTTRRLARAPKRTAYLDLPTTIRHSIGFGGEILRPAWRQRRRKPRPLTVICDVSGSMDRYSRLFLHFIYALARSSTQQHIEAFVFGTRLTRITPALRQRNVDRVLDDVSALVQDWAGGTRIGEALKTFNFVWARRTLGRGAVAIIISDGWDRGDLALLGREIARLHRSVHRLIWLNPLLGAPGYQPLAAGIRTVLPHVDDFLPLHNLVSLEALARRLSAQAADRRLFCGR